jgi:hypothetical protein
MAVIDEADLDRVSDWIDVERIILKCNAGQGSRSK